MMLPKFESFFPGFADPDVPQPYDDAVGAEEALTAYHNALAASIGRTKDDATWARDLTDTLTTAVQGFVTTIMPPELATENGDYVVEQDHGARLTLEDQINRLHEDKDAEDTIYFRLSNATLEQNFQSVLDQLTARRIAEEMDTPTFIERARSAFRRARDGALAQSTALEPQMARAQIIAHRLGILSSISGFLTTDLSGKLSKEAKEAIDGLSRLVARSHEFVDHFQGFLRASQTSLTRVQRDFAAPANIAGAEGESRLVSREVERHAFFRPLPLLWALAVTFLAKVVLANNTSEMLHYLAVPILLATFVLTWVLSIYIGVRARSERMVALQDHMRDQLHRILFVERSDSEFVEFPRIPPDHETAEPEPLVAYTYRGRAKQHSASIVRWNLVALLIPAVLLIFVVVSRRESDHDFIARFDNSDPCVLASGKLVFATSGSYFVLPQKGRAPLLQRAVSRVFPELFADIIDRSAVIGVRSHDTAGDLVDCVAPDGRAGGDAVTVNLGDTSIDLLSTAIAATGSGGQARIIDPVLIDARSIIELELSKSDASDIDLTNVIATLKIVQERLGGEVSPGVALALLFGGSATASAKLELPETLIAMLSGSGGLPEEMTAIRVALENANTLSATLNANVDASDTSELVALLDQRLSALIKEQKDLRLALVARAEAFAGDTVVVTPSVFPAAQGGDQIDTHIFQTSIEVTGTDEVLNTTQDTLVLPFFTEPVRSETTELATPQGAFDWGADTTNLRDVEVTRNGDSYFSRIAKTLDACLSDGSAVLDVDVIGLASRSWDGPTNAYPSAVLNYHLAEGRRFGALKRLAWFMDPDARQRLFVQVSGGERVALDELLAREVEEKTDILLPRFGRFDGMAEFENRREVMLAVTGLDPTGNSPLEELFARSVVLRLVSSDSGPCAF